MSPRLGLLRSGLALLILVAASGAHATPLTRDQQKCATLMAGRLRGLTSVRLRDGLSCLARANKGELGGAFGSCVGDDQPGKVTTAQAKVGADFDKRCTGESRKPPGVAKLPPFGVTSPPTVNAAARDHALGLFRDLLGNDLESAPIAKASDAAGALCQLRLATAATRCEEARLADFTRCLKSGLRDKAAPFASAGDVTSCIDRGANGKAAKRCDLLAGKRLDAIRKTLDKRCLARGVALGMALPGCGAGDREATHACLDHAVRCRVCLAVSAASGLGGDCDTVDDGSANLSCPPAALATSPFVVEVPPFLARVVADRASGIPGTTFNLRVEAPGVTVVASEWSTNDGFTATGPTMQVSFTAPGLHPIDVTIRDDQDRSVTTGIELIVFDPAASGGVRKGITPDHGGAGTLVQITSPALLDADAVFSVVIGADPPVEPFRPQLGAANLAIPFTAAAGIGGPTPVGIKLLADGVMVEEYSFVVSPAPPIPGAPGELTREAMEALPPLVAELRAALPRQIADANLTADEVSTLLALLDAAAFISRDVGDQALTLLGKLDPAVLTAIDQVMVANGLAPDFRAPAAAAGLFRPLALPGEGLLQNCCRFHQANDALQSVVGPLRFAAPLIALAGLAGGPVSGPILVGIANAALQLGTVGDLAALVAKIIPKPDDRLVVTTSLSRIPPGSNEQAIIRVKGRLTLDIDLCQQALDGVIAELAKAILARTLPRMPFNTFAREVLRRTQNADLNVRNEATMQVFQELSDFLADVLNRLASGIVDVSGLDKTLANAKVKICNQSGNLEVPIQPTPEIMGVLPGTGGSLGPYNAEDVRFSCGNGFAGTAKVRAVYPCGAKTLEGEVQITCGEETCSEDAAAAIETIVTQTYLDRGLVDCQNAPVAPFQSFIRVARVRFKNTHPTRTIAISFVVKDEANAERYDTPPCQGAECDNYVGRCFEFIQPGHTTSEVAYNCEAVFDSPVVNGTGVCLTGPVMTTGTLIAQATYCDFSSPNKDLFCEDVSRFLLETETPHASFSAIQRSCQ